MKPGTPARRSTHFFDPLRERIRYLLDSLQTEKAYLYRVRLFIRWHSHAGGACGIRATWAGQECRRLNKLVNERGVSPSTPNHALSACCFCTATGWRLTCPGLMTWSKAPNPHPRNYHFNSFSWPSDAGNGHFSPKKRAFGSVLSLPRPLAHTKSAPQMLRPIRQHAQNRVGGFGWR